MNIKGGNKMRIDNEIITTIDNNVKEILNSQMYKNIIKTMKTRRENKYKNTNE